MKKASLAYLLLMVCGLPCLAQSEVISRTSIYDHPDYSEPMPALRELVREKARGRRNTFYISKVQTFSNGYDHAWVYWKEGNALILWEPFLTGTDREHELVWSSRYLRFGKEIVPPERYYEGSDFLTWMKDGREIADECVRDGVKFVVIKPSRKPRRAQSNNGMQRTRKSAPLLSSIVGARR